MPPKSALGGGSSFLLYLCVKSVVPGKRCAATLFRNSDFVVTSQLKNTRQRSVSGPAENRALAGIFSRSAAPPFPAEPRRGIASRQQFYRTSPNNHQSKKPAEEGTAASRAFFRIELSRKNPPSTAPQLKAPPHPEPPAPRTGHSGYPAPGTAPPIQPRPPGDRARRHRKGWGSRRPCAPGGTAGAVCP